jgi:hypothetical protein
VICDESLGGDRPLVQPVNARERLRARIARSEHRSVDLSAAEEPIRPRSHLHDDTTLIIEFKTENL